LPGDPFVPGNLEERDLAARIADENIVVGQDLDARKPPNTLFPTRALHVTTTGDMQEEDVLVSCFRSQV
jgi:hypothetical protein